MNIKKLEAWYQDNHRKLPFRDQDDPYKTWVSEIMLQQTQVETVLPFFNSFIQKYPSVFELAKTDLETLKKDVEGLGYYRRFKLMHETAKIIVDQYQGKFPKTYKEIINLPGIGTYTAGAILSIAYNLPISAVDGNVIRVLARYYGLFDDFRLDKNKKKLDQINQTLIEKATPNIYTQALMELGALICRPKSPACVSCPLNDHCVAYHDDITHELPVLSKLKKQKEFHYMTLIIEDDEHIYLRKRTESLLEGMYEYPQFEAESINYVLNELSDQNIELKNIKFIDHYTHVFSHQIWKMEVYQAKLVDHYKEDWIPIKKEKMSNLPMAIAHKKIKR